MKQLETEKWLPYLWVALALLRHTQHQVYPEPCPKQINGLVGRSVNSVTLRAPLLGQGKAHFAGNGVPFPRSATQNWPSSG
ncbi:MAG: hypothetical protein PVI97_11015, partial [Candidatus Thiodiazotropha sp.]